MTGTYDAVDPTGRDDPVTSRSVTAIVGSTYCYAHSISRHQLHLDHFVDPVAEPDRGLVGVAARPLLVGCKVGRGWADEVECLEVELRIVDQTGAGWVRTFEPLRI